jgi:hypothetical protein
MDRLPCELLYHIVWYIDEPTDLLRMSGVCSRWRSFIMNRKYFLNQWFSRSLKRSVKSYSIASYSYSNESYYLSKLNTDQSLLPIKLRSSSCQFLPWTDLEHSSHYKLLFEHCYSLSFYDSSHSFSFWLFLPHQYELNIQIGNCNVNNLNISIDSDENYHSDNGKNVSIADRWVHFVLNKIDSQSNYQIWIDGQCISKFDQYHITLDELCQHFSSINILLLRKPDNSLSEGSTQARIANLKAFKRCLTPVEIRAIHQQQTSIKKVKVGTYINSRKYTTRKSTIAGKAQGNDATCSDHF